MLNKIHERLDREKFITTPIALICNPLYIIRNGLYKNIKPKAELITGKILDFGCGSKPYQSLFLNAESYIGVDTNDSGHNHIESTIDVFYDGRNLPFEDSYFDAVVSFEVFEHLFNIDEIIKEIYRVLKSDGKLMISIPFAWIEHEEPFDFARYTSYGIEDILLKNGFTNINLQKTTSYLLAISQLTITLLSDYVKPLNMGLRVVFQVLVVFPMTVIAVVLDKIFPKRYEFYCSAVITCEKTSS